jgi:hypothetical protein
MTLAPFLFFVPARVHLAGITELTYTCIGTKVLPRAQGWNALSDRRPRRGAGRSLCATIIPVSLAGTGEQGAAALLSNRDDR